MDKSLFLNKIVVGWIKNDLTRMKDTIRPVPSGVGNINFPLALCTLAYMEYLGSFLLGSDKNFDKNVKAYIDECFENKKEYPIEVLGDLFRHGLAHEYFPRGAVSRNGKHPAVYKGNNYDIVLDAETLVIDFINSLDKFSLKLDDVKFNRRMEKSLKKIKTLKEKHAYLIEKLDSQENDGALTTPSVAYPGSETKWKQYSSGASGIDRSMYTTSDPSMI